jgi:hypothetical protein
MTAFVVQPHRPELRSRQGLPPLATRPFADDVFGHQQLTQIAPDELQEQLFVRVRSLPGVKVSETGDHIAPGTRTFLLEEDFANGPSAAFQATSEFAHLHPGGDGAIDLTLPRGVRDAVFAAGWGEAHPVTGTPLIYGPRTVEELEVVWQIVIVSYRFAVGDLGDADSGYSGASVGQSVAPAAPVAETAPAAESTGQGWVTAETFDGGYSTS